MPRILVTKPFKARFDRTSAGKRDFAVGEHTLTQAELEDWFVQACIADGRAELLPDVEATADEAETVKDTPAADAKDKTKGKGK
jgi:hypothetical protein